MRSSLCRVLLFSKVSAIAIALVTGCNGSVVVGSGGGGGSGGGSGSASGGAVGGQQHPSCSQPSPTPLPPLPEVNQTISGRPKFDLWRDVDCNAATSYLCGALGPGEACLKLDVCLTSMQNGGGVCNYQDADFWCDGEGEALGYRYNQCWICAPIESHAAACCAGIPGFDCRSWPYPSDGEIGTVCAIHEDCEPGLVCGPTAGKGFGICQCPGMSPDSVKPEPDCN